MLHLVKTDRSYPPDIVAAMTVAFDSVCQSLSTRISDDESIRRRLALIILGHVDSGERDSTRLANTALRELVGSDRSEIGERSATG